MPLRTMSFGLALLFVAGCGSVTPVTPDDAAAPPDGGLPMLPDGGPLPDPGHDAGLDAALDAALDAGSDAGAPDPMICEALEARLREVLSGDGCACLVDDAASLAATERAACEAAPFWGWLHDGSGAYHPEHLEEALAGVISRCSLRRYAADVPLVVNGGLAVGAACERADLPFVDPCAEGARCVGGTCLAPAAEGDSCDGRSCASPDLYCDIRRVCRRYGGVGDPCVTYASTCAFELTCRAGYCEPRFSGGEGDECSFPDHCAEGLTCSERRCRALAPHDAPCDDRLDCTSGICRDGRCLGPLERGAACELPPEPERACGIEPAAYCVDGCIDYEQCLEPCADGGHCRDGLCQRSLRTGEACASSDECIGDCVDGVCRDWVCSQDAL